MEFCFSLAERDNKWWMLQGHLVATSVNRNGFFQTKSWVTELDPEMQLGSDLGPQWTSAPTSAPSTGCPSILSCGWTSTELISDFTLVTNSVRNRSQTYFIEGLKPLVVIMLQITPDDGLIEKLINILLLYAFKILSPTKFYTKCMEGGWKWCKVQLRHCKLKSICRHDKAMLNECKFEINIIFDVLTIWCVQKWFSRKHVTQVKNCKEIADLEKLSTNSNPLGLYGQLSPYSPHLWMLCFHEEELNVQCNNTLHKD